MKLILTSCGLQTEGIKEKFLSYLTKSPLETKAIFIPTAAVYPDAINVLPKCLRDLTKCGIPNSNITVYDMHLPISNQELLKHDVVYICGGIPHYLLQRINEHKFGSQLNLFLKKGGIIVGVSAGSIVFAKNLPDNIGIFNAELNVHCSPENSVNVGELDLNNNKCINLGNDQAIVFDDMGKAFVIT